MIVVVAGSGEMIVVLAGSGSASLRIYNITVPEVVLAGNSTVIDCQWKAKGHALNAGGLYSLKWYHGLHEFYRWTPDDVAPMKVMS
ncbi:hypothetical protein HAZT_HAZT012109 [Hyalella azteca]|uniref:Uncharacterized protein n=1 Tax=Hyalella azteca TaxID=294128 RepID=A0A6A0H3T2_HYAAZ|nr:hypothetical protein HAZT_HAZT012109 [Hyalella azteca]